MAELPEKDAMICRACGNEERASEGYPCSDCGTFICVMCSFRGVMQCSVCASAAAQAAEPDIGTPSTMSDWPEH